MQAGKQAAIIIKHEKWHISLYLTGKQQNGIEQWVGVCK